MNSDAHLSTFTSSSHRLRACDTVRERQWACQVSMRQPRRTVKTVLVPAKCFSSASLSGPSPTNASRACGILSRMSLSTYRFFSARTASTAISTLVLEWD